MCLADPDQRDADDDTSSCLKAWRLVGDPIEVATGANVDVAVDLRLAGPFPLRWRRHYSSARSTILGALGWGHTHDFDRSLIHDLDGARYTEPNGNVVAFPPLAVGEEAVSAGFVLRRLSSDVFELFQTGHAIQQFEFRKGSTFSPLRKLIRHGSEILFRYDAREQLVEIVDSLRRSIAVESFPDGRIRGLFLPSSPGSVTRQTALVYEYDDAGNLRSGTDLYRTAFYFEWDHGNRMTRRTDRRGYSFHFAYDVRGRCTHSTGDDGLFEVFLEYKPEENATHVRRGDGGRWVYAYDKSGTITSIRDPYGNTTNFTLDDRGRVVEEIDENGNVTRLLYDTKGRHYARQDPLGHELPTYSSNPKPPDPLAYRLPDTCLEWEHGHLLPTDRVQGLSNGATPQLLSRLVATRLAPTEHRADGSDDPEPSALSDEQGRPLRDNVPQPQRWKFDANGNIAEHRDRDGSVYRYTYHSWNALHEQIDPLGHVTVYGQSGEGLVNRVEDPGGTLTEYVYDLKDRLVEVHSNGQIHETYGYDAAANIIEKRDSRHQVLVTWDVGPATLDRVRTLRSGDSHTFEYDESGRIVQAFSPEGEVTRAFDNDGRRLVDKRDGKGVSHEFVGETQVATVYLDRFRIEYARGADGAHVISDPTGARHRVFATDDGVVTKDLACGVREQGLYDRDGRCLAKVWTSGRDTTPWSRSSEYSPEGDLVRVNDSARGTFHYVYDAAHRLAEEILPDGERHRYTIDAAGNVTGKPGLSGVVVGTQNRLVTASNEQFVYNERAHVSSREGLGTTCRYEYDALDRLVRCELDGEVWTVRYDALCRRIDKTWRGETTTYHWDDFRLAAECQDDGRLRLYVYEDHRALVPFMFVDYDSVEAPPESGRRFYVFVDQVGAPIRVDDESGRKRWGARIEPYGLAHVDAGSDIELSLRFPGHWYDPELRLHYNRFRYYSPELARYIQSDPAGLEGSINEYAYPESPLVDVDIDGLTKKRGGVATSRPSGKKAKGAPAGADANCPLHERVGWVAPYGEQKKVTGDGSVDRDHQPSKLAIKKAIKDDIDKRVAKGMDPPTKKQMEEINKRIDANAQSAVVKHEVHKAGDTHGTQNKEQSEIDKKDLGKAAAKDADNMVAATKKLDPENTAAAKAAAKKIKEQSHESIMEENRQIVDDVLSGN